MIKAIIFGGTTEGRELCEFCSANKIPVLYSAATQDGARAVENLPYIKLNAARINISEMTELINKHKLKLIIDATHPFAKEVSFNISAASNETRVKLIRVLREDIHEEGLRYFDGTDNLINWLSQTKGVIFAAIGALKAKELTTLYDFKTRVWLRILPNELSLKTCLDLGFLPQNLICMQGPFSQEMNYIMFKNAKAEILVTKESGKTGGFLEKINAARDLNMEIAVIKKPVEENGFDILDAEKLLLNLCL